MATVCDKPFSECRDILCKTHGLSPLAAKRYVGLRQPGESDVDVQKRLYEEAMASRCNTIAA